MKTKVAEMLHIKHPIIQGRMQNIAYPVLAAAVSNVGGLGIINATDYKTPDSFHGAIRKMKQLTNRPLCVNISTLPDLDAGDHVRQFIHICDMEQVAAIETAGTKPDKLISLIHDVGIIHIHKAPTARYGVSAQSCGVDAVTAVGYECDGYPGMNGIGTMVLANEASRSPHIPVIAGGGIVDGQGITTTLTLGAKAVVMGAHFLATTEAPIGQNHKERITHSTEASTILIQESIHNMMRATDSNVTRTCLNMENQGTSLQELMSVISGAKGKEMYETGRLEDGIFPIGMGYCLIRDIKPVGEAMKELAEEVGHVLGFVAERVQGGKSKAAGSC